MRLAQETCELCGQRARVEGGTTKFYVGLEKVETEKWRTLAEELAEALSAQCVCSFCSCYLTEGATCDNCKNKINVLEKFKAASEEKK